MKIQTDKAEMNNTLPPAVHQQRGPIDHSVRDQIVLAATQHFSLYGYDKTTVSELGKTIGFSKAYIYKFFDSKQSIGEAICANCLGAIAAAVDVAIRDAPSASERFRRMFRALVESGIHLFFQDRKLYDIASVSARERWPSARAHDEYIKRLIQDILREGRETGEFERKTPLDEATSALYLVVRPYLNPLLLQHCLDDVEQSVVQLSSLVLRSLAP